ncbi:MAG: hypothetical protein KUG73_03800, partial [Pseudomonadales bacterium]|nr:hypothetical protein [Pseudomonadales bacterium]
LSTLVVADGDRLRFGGSYKMVNLDEFILQQRPMTEGTKVILNPGHIKIAARIKRHPEKRNVEYLYGALRMMQVEPMPEVNYRMFIESDEGQIIPVYVEDAIALQISKKITLDTRVLLKGYHVYNYSKGPAIVIESVEAG